MKTSVADTRCAIDGVAALHDHIVTKARAARASFADPTSSDWMGRFLSDRTIVRYPLGVRYDAQPLRCGEFACLESLGETPSDGFVLFVHPMLEGRMAQLPLVVAYFVPSVNYGAVASREEAELFGATLFAMPQDAYYAGLRAIADEVRCRTS